MALIGHRAYQLLRENKAQFCDQYFKDDSVGLSQAFTTTHLLKQTSLQNLHKVSKISVAIL